MGAFTVNVRDWIERKKTGMDNVVTGTILAVATNIDQRSPVGDRELWAVNDSKQLKRETYQVFREASGKPRVSTKSLERNFGTLQPKGYVGGRFRANWQLGVDSVPTGELYERSPPASGYPDGAAVVAANMAKIPKDASGHVFYYVNNLPYGPALEEGHSTQAPTGMVAITVREIQSYVDAAARAEGFK